MEEASGLIRGDATLGTPDDFVAKTLRRIPVVAVGDDVRHRWLFRALILERFDLIVERVATFHVLGRQGIIDLALGHADGEDLRSQKLLARRTLAFGFEHRALDVLGKTIAQALELKSLAVRQLDRRDLIFQHLLLGIDRRVVFLVTLRFLGREERIVRLHLAEDRGMHPVIVFLQDRIELVIVAARTVNGQTQESSTDGSNHIIEVVVPPLGVIFFAEQDARSSTKKSGSDPGLVGSVIDLVTSDLFFEELIVGFVVVERIDDVVAAAPGIGAIEIMLEPARVRVARHVEPMTTPALTVVRRSQ